MSIGHRDYSSTSPTVSITAADDLRTHEVREIDIMPAARGGRYPTLCGQLITAASMAEPARRRCRGAPSCATATTSRGRRGGCGGWSGSDRPGTGGSRAGRPAQPATAASRP